MLVIHDYFHLCLCPKNLFSGLDCPKFLHALFSAYIDGGKPNTLPTDSSGNVQLTIEPRDAASMEKKNSDDYKNMITQN